MRPGPLCDLREQKVLRAPRASEMGSLLQYPRFPKAQSKGLPDEASPCPPPPPPPAPDGDGDGGGARGCTRTARLCARNTLGTFSPLPVRGPIGVWLGSEKTD